MNWNERIHRLLAEREQAKLYRTLEITTGRSFIHNDYLGLASHPLVVEAGIRALENHGAGSRGSRLLGGHSRLFEAVEEKIAGFFGAPAALFFSSGYLANLAGVRTLAELAGHVISDEKNHASLIDAIRLSGVPKKIIPHNRWDLAGNIEPSLLVSEALFSMDGDFADLMCLYGFAEKTGSYVFLDEAHSGGIFLEDGKGVHGRWSDFERLAVTVTFGKAFGVSGAAILCSKPVRELLINVGRAFIYTTAPSPAIPAMVSAALDLVGGEGQRRKELWSRSLLARSTFREAGMPIPPETSEWERSSPIIPLILGGEDRTLRFCETMRKLAVQLKAIRYPTVAKGTERVRISMTLAETRQETELLINEVVRQWKALSSSE